MTRTTRRQVLAAGAAAAGLAAVPTATAQPDLEEWLSNTDDSDEVLDRTGQDGVEIAVGAQGNGGGFAFDPVVVRVDPGTEVTWTWTGDGGSHNVVARDGQFESDLHDEAGTTFTHTPGDPGVVPYSCTPHETVGMKGALVVGDVAVGIGDGGGTDDGEGGDGGDGGEGDQPQTTRESGGDGGTAGGDGETTTPEEDEGPFDGWLASTDGFDGVVDRTGEDVVTVTVGAEGNGGRYAFDPPAVHVDPGTTVVWEWTTDAEHDLQAVDGGFGSGPVDQVGERHAVRFTGERTWKYECATHSDRGMRGVVVVGRPGVPASRENGVAVVGGLGLIGVLFALARTLADRGDEGGDGGGADGGPAPPDPRPAGD